MFIERFVRAWRRSYKAFPSGEGGSKSDKMSLLETDEVIKPHPTSLALGHNFYGAFATGNRLSDSLCYPEGEGMIAPSQQLDKLKFNPYNTSGAVLT